jgi:hypothetical protein
VHSFAGDVRTEELEVDLGDRIEREAGRFLEACGVEGPEAAAAVDAALAEASRSGAAILRVRLQDGAIDVSVTAPYAGAVARG